MTTAMHEHDEDMNERNESRTQMEKRGKQRAMIVTQLHAMIYAYMHALRGMAFGGRSIS